MPDVLVIFAASPFFLKEFGEVVKVEGEVPSSKSNSDFIQVVFRCV